LERFGLSPLASLQPEVDASVEDQSVDDLADLNLQLLQLSPLRPSQRHTRRFFDVPEDNKEDNNLPTTFPVTPSASDISPQTSPMQPTANINALSVDLRSNMFDDFVDQVHDYPAIHHLEVYIDCPLQDIPEQAAQARTHTGHQLASSITSLVEQFNILINHKATELQSKQRELCNKCLKEVQTMVTSLSKRPGYGAALLQAEVDLMRHEQRAWLVEKHDTAHSNLIDYIYRSLSKLREVQLSGLEDLKGLDLQSIQAPLVKPRRGSEVLAACEAVRLHYAGVKTDLLRCYRQQRKLVRTIDRAHFEKSSAFMRTTLPSHPFCGNADV
jgi:hypothetical protein